MSEIPDDVFDEMHPTEIAERLKDVAHEMGARALKATIPTGSDAWTTIEIRHASIWTDGGDGWNVEITRGEL